MRFYYLGLIMCVFVASFISSMADEDPYPTCGKCWCIPNDSDPLKCPPDSIKPNMSFSAPELQAYLDMVPDSDTVLSLYCNPYEDSACTTTPPQSENINEKAVCAFIPSTSTLDIKETCGHYRMQTYSSRSHAEADNATVTHTGACGLCSTAHDLSIYLSSDFTEAGKKCATKGILNESAGLDCYMNDVGLTLECAKIWNYDGIYDGSVCTKTCLQDLNLMKPNNGPPPTCTLNPCLQCDEDEAGPIFSNFAGRTRRSSGLLSEIIRDCSSIAHIKHVPDDCLL